MTETMLESRASVCLASSLDRSHFSQHDARIAFHGKERLLVSFAVYYGPNAGRGDGG